MTSLQNDPEFLMAQARREFHYYEPHAKQSLFHELGASAPERLFLAGNRTGKTYGGAVEMAMHLTGMYPEWWKGHRFSHPINAWALGDINETIRSTLQQYYVGDPPGSHTWNKRRMGTLHPSVIISIFPRRGIPGGVDLVRVKHVSGGTSTLQFKSYEQGRKAFQSARLDAVHADEEPPINIYRELLMRLMSVDGRSPGIMLVTATPLCGMSETILQFLHPQTLETTIPEGDIVLGRAYVQAGWNDNPHLMDEEKARFRASWPAHELEARERGVPSLGLGLVYPVSESVITCAPFVIPDYWPRVFALDFGWNPSPTAALFAAHDRDNDVLYITGEYAVKELTPQHHAGNLLKLGADWMPGVYDPAGRISSLKDGEKLVDLYQEAGIRYLSKADNSKEKGLMRVLQRMQNGQLKIFSSLSRTLTEFRMYARDEDGIPKKGNDHLMDCLRYIIMSGLSIARSKVHPLQYYRGLGGHELPYTAPAEGDWMRY